MLWNRSRPCPTEFLILFQSSNPIGQSNVIVDTWPAYLDCCACAIAQIKGCGVRDIAWSIKSRTRRWLPILLSSPVRPFSEVQFIEPSDVSHGRTSRWTLLFPWSCFLFFLLRRRWLNLQLLVHLTKTKPVEKYIHDVHSSTVQSTYTHKLLCLSVCYHSSASERRVCDKIELTSQVFAELQRFTTCRCKLDWRPAQKVLIPIYSTMCIYA